MLISLARPRAVPLLSLMRPSWQSTLSLLPVLRICFELSAFVNAALEPPVLKSACLCPLGSGWVDAIGQCRRGAFTTCDACPERRDCAVILSPIGKGISSFNGDCLGDAPSCQSPAAAGLSFPTAIAIDKDDNIFFTDTKNNRVRMVSVGQNFITTVAGTGLMGFVGDGGPAVQASMRYPEGISIRLSPFTGLMEIAIADSMNQRLRLLTRVVDPVDPFAAPTPAPLPADQMVFNIKTILGTGRQDYNLACDWGCAASTAFLDNPRLVTFAQSGDLYFYDSGNVRIMKLYANFTTLIRLVGGRRQGTNTLDVRLGMLPGEELMNHDVPLLNVNVLGIDPYENMWYADSLANRVWVTPLTTDYFKTTSGVLSRFMNSYFMHFVPENRNRTRMFDTLVDGFRQWLPYTSVTDLTYKTTTPKEEFPLIDRDPLALNKSRWIMGNSFEGSWCSRPYDAVACPPVTPSALATTDLKGLCFSPAYDMVLVDMMTSQVMRLKKMRRKYASLSDGQVMTTSGCRCAKSWVSHDELMEIGQVPQVSYLTCGPNYNSSIRPAPNCTTTTYSAQQNGDLAPLCYVNLSAYAPNDDCSSERIGVADLAPAGTQYSKVVDVTLYGNELRATVASRCTDDIDYASMFLSIDRRLKTNNSTEIPKNSRLLGFSLDNNNLCKGIVTCQNNSSFRKSYFDCHFDHPVNVQHNEVVECVKSLCTKVSSKATAYLIWDKIFSVEVCDASPDEKPNKDEKKCNPITYCRDVCTQNGKCQSFMVEIDEVGEPLADNRCIFFGATYPYGIYSFDRWKWVNASDPLEEAQLKTLRSQFVEARVTDIFLSDFENGLHVSEHSQKWLAHIPAETLSLEGCQTECIRNTSCWGIAFPGCYLLQGDASSWIEHTLHQSVRTAVFTKRSDIERVEGVAGQYQVNSFSDEGSRAQGSFLNKPTGCAFDSAGRLYIADTWNHRIRRIDGLRIACHFDATSNTLADLNTWISLINASHTSCSNGDTTRTIYYDMQKAVSAGDMSTYEQRFCYYNPPGDAASFLSDDTSNTLVLCKLCDELFFNATSRPPVCPPTQLCECQASIVSVLRSSVYGNCEYGDSRYDAWHRWVTAYTHCLWKPNVADLEYLTIKTKGDALKSKLQNYTSR